MTRALIVDDKPENLYLLRALLQGHGHEVVEARHGAEALLKARADPPGLVISDLLMPVMDGYTLLRQWKADVRLQAIPFVVYTATYTDPKDERLALDLGADAFILKPAEPAAFMLRIGEVLERQRRGELPAAHAPLVQEETQLAEYSKVLVRKLEEKSFQLERTNREQREDIARRERAEAEIARLLGVAERARTALLGILEDERATKASLRESEIRYRQLVEVSPDPMLLHSEWRIVYVNRAMLELLGAREAAQVIGQPATFPLASESVAPAQERIRRLYAGEPQGRSEQIYRRLDGSTVPVEVASAPFVLEGRPAVQVTVRDISERRRMEEALRASERRFRLAAATGDVWDADVGAGRGHVPAHFKQVLGYEDHEIENTVEAFAALVHPDDRTLWLDALRNHFVRRLPYEFEFRARCKSGEYRWFATRGQAAWDESGRATYMAGTVFDITERKRAEQALRDRERQLATLIANLPGVVYRCRADSDYAMEFVSDGVVALTGCPAQDFLQRGRSIADFVHPADRDALWAETKAAVDAGRPYEMTYRMVDVAGRERWVWERGAGVRNPAGEVVALEGFVADITERRRAEEAVREHEALLRSVLETLPVGVWVADAAGKIVLGNSAGQRIWAGAKYVAIEQFGEYKGWWAASGKRIEPEEWALARAITRGETSLEEEIDIECFDGSRKTILNSAVPLRNADGRITGAIVVNQDITERRQAQLAIRESEEKLRLFVDHAPSAIAMFDRDMRYVACSRRWLADYGLGDQDLTGRSHYEVFPDLPERWKAIHRRCLAGAVEKADDDPFPRAGGTTDWVRWEVHPWRAAGGEIGGIILFSEVVTERKRAEEALRDANERLRALSARLLEVQEAERAAIARELHDEIGQSLTALKLGTQALARRVDAAAGESVARLVAIADRTLAQTRSLSLDLRPPQLDQLGLAATLRDTLQRIADAAGIDARLVAEPEDIALERSVATAAFRVAQEALTNAVRHAAARHLVVELRATHDALQLAVSDDGRGFDLEAARGRAVKGGSVGLLGMEERVALAGGELRIITRPGQGTRVQARFPLLPPAGLPPAGSGL